MAALRGGLGMSTEQSPRNWYIPYKKVSNSKKAVKGRLPQNACPGKDSFTGILLLGRDCFIDMWLGRTGEANPMFKWHLGRMVCRKDSS